MCLTFTTGASTIAKFNTARNILVKIKLLEKCKERASVCLATSLECFHENQLEQHGVKNHLQLESSLNPALKVQVSKQHMLQISITMEISDLSPMCPQNSRKWNINCAHVTSSAAASPDAAEQHQATFFL